METNSRLDGLNYLIEVAIAEARSLGLPFPAYMLRIALLSLVDGKAERSPEDAVSREQPLAERVRSKLPH